MTLQPRNVPLSKPLIGDDEKQAVMKVLDSGMLAQGPVTESFEKAFAQFVGVPHAVAVSNGTAALQIAMLAHGIGAGDEVITSSFSFIASGNSVIYTGAKPVFVDIDPVSYNMDPALIEKAITPKTKALQVVHLFGNPMDMDAVVDICKRRNLILIEDACQSHGASFKGTQVGAFGTGGYSFYPTKNMTSGEGGMITFSDEKASKRARMIRNHGMQERYKHEMMGYNLRMTDLHAAVGVAQLKKLAERNALRRKHAAYLTANLKNVVTPVEQKGGQHVFHQYTIRVKKDRDAAVKHLQSLGVGVGIYYPRPIHQQPVFLEMGFKVSLPETEKAAQEVLSIPVRPDMTQEDLDHVVAAVNAL